MKTLGEVLLLSVEYMQKKGVERPRKSVEELFASVLGCKRLDLYLQFDRPMQEEELVQLRSYVQRRGSGEPEAYILGEVDFFDITLEVSRDTLIPRVETEQLASEVANQINGEMPLVVWDLCCGSGALGLSLKKKFPHFQVILSDISKKALEVARRNANKNQLEVEFREGDFLTPFYNQKADVIVCNPPYVSMEEFEHLDPSVKNYEPKEALIGGEDGLFFYKKLAREVKIFLHPKARVYLEIGSAQGESVSQLFSPKEWAVRLLKRDLSGRDRFFFLETE